MLNFENCECPRLYREKMLKRFKKKWSVRKKITEIIYFSTESLISKKITDQNQLIFSSTVRVGNHLRTDNTLFILPLRNAKT